MSAYTPDKWTILELVESHGGKLYKVVASWSGGYLYGASWKINSGIESISETAERYNFTGYSGSVYSCFKDSYGMTTYTASVVQNLMEKIAEHSPRLLSEEEALELIKNWK